MSVTERKKVLFSDSNSNFNDKLKDINVVKPPVVSQPVKNKFQRRSTGELSDKSQPSSVLKASSSCPSIQSVRKVPSKAPTRKSLVRTSTTKPTEDQPIVRKSHELKTGAVPKTVPGTSKPSKPSKVLPTIPMQHTLLKTKEQIHRISDLDLEAAYKSVDELWHLNTEKLEQKISRLALNVDPDEHIYSDLVSIDVADKDLGPKISDIRKHRERRKRVEAPRLQDFCRPIVHDESQYWPSFPPFEIPFAPMELYDGNAVINKIAEWKEESKRLMYQRGTDVKK